MEGGGCSDRWHWPRTHAWTHLRLSASAGGRVADNLLLLRFKGGCPVAADVVPPDVELDFDAILPDKSVRSVVRAAAQACC